MHLYDFQRTITIYNSLPFRTMEGQNVPLNDPNVCILIINSEVKHELSGSEYPMRRAQCEEAAIALGAAYLRDVSRQTLEGISSA